MKLNRLLSFIAGVLVVCSAAMGAPANDDFANAYILSGTSVVTAGSNTLATLETGEPNHGANLGKTGGKSVWWSWTAPASGGLVWVTNKANFAHMLAVYAGDTVPSLTLLTNNYNSANVAVTVAFVPVAGSTYRIAVDGQSGASGTNSLSLKFLPPPANDFFTNSIALTGASVATAGSNILAGVENLEPLHGGLTKLGGRSVWWNWTAPSGGLVTISNKANFAHILAVYTGQSLAGLTLVNNSFNSANTFATLSFNPVTGTTYQIAVDGQSAASGTNFLGINLIPPPINDDFADALALSGSIISVAGTNTAAIVEPGEPNHGAAFGKTAGKSIWWTWTSPFTGWLQVTNKANYPHIVAIYKGESLGTLTLVGSATNVANSTGALSFYPEANSSYQIAVSTLSTNGGTNLLSLFLQATPVNDRFTNATVLTGTNTVVIGTNYLATMEPGETNHGAAFGKTGGRSIWWAWDSPFAGWVQITNKANYAHIVCVYTGDSVSNLTRVAGMTNIANQAAPLGFYSTPGVTYRIVVDGQSASSGTNTLSLFAQRSPENDNFANACIVSGTNWSVNGNNVAAGSELGEPNHGAEYGLVGGRSIWWRWTAPSGGMAVITNIANYAHLLAVYSGSSVDALTLISSDYHSSNHEAVVLMNPQAGQSYWIAVDGQNGASGSNQLSLSLMPPPSNDLFADRITITGSNPSVVGSNLYASMEPGEPSHGGTNVGTSVWWTWKAPSPGGRVAVTVNGSFRKMIEVYTGNSLASLIRVSSETDFVSSTASASFDSVAGVDYQIVVVGRGPMESFTNFTLGLSMIPIPGNDAFSSATVLTGTNVVVSLASNYSATIEPGEPNHAGRIGGHSVWYCWTAPQSGHYAVLLDGYFNKMAGVYQGNSVGNLTEVARAYAGADQVAQGSFDAIEGATYYIAIDGENGESGIFNLELRLTPLNDDFADAFVLSGTAVSTNGNNAMATKQTGEPAYDNTMGGKSVWYQWIAPQAGRVSITARSPGLDPIVAVYTGNDIVSLNPIAGGYNYKPVPAYANFDAIEGTSYKISVDGRYGTGTNFLLEIAYVDAPANDQFANALWVTNAPQTMSITNLINGNFYVKSSNLGATKESGETAQGSGSVWWRWTAPMDGEVLIELESYIGTMTQPWLGLYTGTSLASLQPVSPRLEFLGSTYYQDTRYPVTAGTTYYIWAANRTGFEGTYTLKGTFEATACNDNFTNRVAIIDTNILDWGYLYRYGWNRVATKEPGEPYHANNLFGGKSVWWSWKPSYTGFATFRVTPVRYVFNSMISVYTGNVLTNLTRVTNMYSSWGDSSVTFPIQKGVEYQFAIDGGGAYGDSGEYKIELDIKVDITPPQVGFTSPYPSEAFYNPTVTVTGTALDPDLSGFAYYTTGLKTIEVSVNGGPWMLASGTANWSQTVTLSHGVNRIAARGADNTGNVSVPTTLLVYLGAAISKTRLNNGLFEARFLTEAGKTYRLEWTPDLHSPVTWHPANAGSVTGTGLMEALTDPDPKVNQRFYRLVVE